MKNFTLLICFVFIAFFKLSAQQPWAKPGAHWYFSDTNGIDYIGYREFWKDANDTVINGINCDVLHDHIKGMQYFLSFPYDRNLPNKYTYQSNDSVFFWKDNIFKLLYVFNTPNGGSWTGSAEYNICSDDTIVIDQASIVTINGINLKRLIPEPYVFVDSFDPEYMSIYFNDTIYERIGHIGGFFPTEQCITDGAYYKLRCYSDNSGFNFTTNISPSCVFITSVNEISGIDNIKVFPNPVNDVLKIDFISQLTQMKEISLTDLNGKKVLTESTKETSFSLNVSKVSAGIYFLSADAGNKKVFKKISVTH